MISKCVLALLLSCSAVRFAPAQAAASTVPPLTYEFISIKPNASGDRSIYLDVPGGTYRNISLKNAVAYAFDVPHEQLSGGPAWIDSAHFDMVGKLSDGDQAVFNKLQKREQERRLLLQHLLADRFALKVAHETRVVNGYILVVAKGGLRMKPSGQGGPDAQIPSCTPYCMMAADDPKGTTGSLAETLTSVLGAPVEDQTALKGTFEIHYVVPSQKGGDPEEDHYAIRQAMQDQLGIQVKPEHVSADCIRIDSAELPSPN